MKFVFDRVENIVGEKGENAGNRHFLFFIKCLRKPHIHGAQVVETEACFQRYSF